MDDAGWNYGVPISEIREFVEYWQQIFNWKEQEAKLNTEISQYTLDIVVDGFETLNIHFMHQPSIVKHAIPLLFVHGCKSTYMAGITLFALHVFMELGLHRAWKLPRSVQTFAPPY